MNIGGRSKESLRERLLEAHERARAAGLPSGVDSFPPVVQRFFSNIAGFEPAEFIRRLSQGHGRKVLVVGVGAGRDAYWLLRDGFEVVSVDIAYQENIPALALGDMAALPFRSDSLDVVVVADVLEHSFDDHKAICEFSRVLRPTGAFVLNIPYRDDRAEYHARVYSERTLRRLLASGGFRIETKIYRGLFPWLETYLPGARALWHAANLLSTFVFTKPFYERALLWMTGFDWRHGKRSFLRRFSRVHGVFLKAVPTLEAFEMTEVNRLRFQNQATSLGRQSSRCDPVSSNDTHVRDSGVSPS